jgi:hypothetical protein
MVKTIAGAGKTLIVSVDGINRDCRTLQQRRHGVLQLAEGHIQRRIGS